MPFISASEVHPRPCRTSVVALWLGSDIHLLIVELDHQGAPKLESSRKTNETFLGKFSR
jgi:hypothetical protein